jgi:hypothetical protein
MHYRLNYLVMRARARLELDIVRLDTVLGPDKTKYALELGASLGSSSRLELNFRLAVNQA